MTARYPKRRSDVRAQPAGEELVILDRQGEAVHHLNVTAAFLWTACDGTLTETELAERLAGRFDVEPDVAARDVAQLLEDLRRSNLLERAPGSEAGR
jgi:hypothetical protein